MPNLEDVPHFTNVNIGRELRNGILIAITKGYCINQGDAIRRALCEWLKGKVEIGVDYGQQD